MTPIKKGKNSKNKIGGKAANSAASTSQPAHEKENPAVVLLKRELEERITSLTESNRQLKRKIFDLYTIFDISRNFNAVLEYQQLLDTFIFTSMAQVSASKAAIYLEPHRNDNFFVVTKQKGSGPLPDTRLKFKNGSTLVDYLAKLNRPSKTEDLIDAVAAAGERKILEKYHPGLVVPLIYQSALIGLLLLSDKISGRDFNNDDIEFLSILGNQISVAIENTRLYEAEKEASQQLMAAQEQLVHSEKLAALGEMSAKVAHEINNPLGIIKNYLLLTRQATDKNETASENLDIVGQEIDRIARIVRELLDFHRPKGFEVKKVDVARVVNDVLMLVERQLESSGIHVVRKFDPKCPQIDASPENLKQVFLNIILNANDAMKQGGTLQVNIQFEAPLVAIRFCDTGPGIPPEIIPRIFEPFFTTKEPSQGTGLGLSVCYGIVRRHNGTITFRNLDKGGCFEIKLPIEDKNRSYEYSI